MSEKMLGRITKAEFGYVGYQDAQFGLMLTIEGQGWGVGANVAEAWSTDVKADEFTNWSESDRDASLAKTCRRINDILRDAKKRHVSQLAGVPVEATFDGTVLSDWRVLTEVL